MNPLITRTKALLSDWFDALLLPCASIIAGLMKGAPLGLCLTFAVGLWLVQSLVIAVVQMGLPCSYRGGLRTCLSSGFLCLIEMVMCIVMLAGTDPDNQTINERHGMNPEAQDALKALTAVLPHSQRQRLSGQIQTLQDLIDGASDSAQPTRPSVSRRMSFSERLSSRRSLHELGCARTR